MSFNRRVFALLCGAMMSASIATAQDARSAGRLSYPQTRKCDQVDDYHGTKIADPYRWLEDDNSAETAAWVAAENEVTFGYLNQIPQRQAIKDRLTKLWNYERFGIPSREGPRYVYSRNEGLQNQSVQWIADKLDGEPRVLLDPNTLSKDGTVALSGMSFSEDGNLLAYGVAVAGSDWVNYKIRDVQTGQDRSDEIKWTKFSGISWMKDGSGFFYSRYDEPQAGAERSSVNKNQKLYYHKLGDPQDKDTLVYARPDQPDWGFGAGVSEDGQYLILSIWQGTERKNRLFYRDLKAVGVGAVASAKDEEIRKLELRIGELRAKAAADRKKAGDEQKKLVEKTAAPSQAGAAPLSDDELKKLNQEIAALDAKRAEMVTAAGGSAFGMVEMLTEFDAAYDFIENDGPLFYFRTDQAAPRGRVIAIDTQNAARANWKELIPQAAKETLQGVNLLNGNQLVCSYLKDATTQVRIFDTSGKSVRDIQMPGLGTAGGFGGKRVDKETFYQFTSYNVPPTIYRLDLTTGASSLFRKPKVEFTGDDYEVKQVFYPSKDGTKIPMFLAHRKGVKLDGANPTLLYGYGGFNQSITPSFSISSLVWMEMGGVYAVANLRGGGEYGKEWHDAGRLANKQNVFDDFIAAGEWLIANKYTNSKKLAIQGGSNGGLLVGACMTQRPELFGACIPEVGVMDMLRFHNFTIGWAWTSDYGSSSIPEQFQWQIKYSPLHNLKPGTKYPATMVTTADHDDRVVPSHSFKFAATLQAAQAGDAPVLIRIQTKAGHGAGKPTSKLIEEAADRWAFLVRNLNMEPKVQ